MTLHRMLFGSWFALVGCLAPAEPAPPASSVEEARSSPALSLTLTPAVAPRPVCPAVVCNADGTCPSCNGQVPTCDAAGTCHYPLGGGGPGGPPVCPAAVCNVDLDCASVCPAAPAPHCVAHVCKYTIGQEDS